MKGKRILLGVTGGIAAYKSADLVRRLIERGAQVQVVMTAAAREFVTPMTFQALSGRRGGTDPRRPPPSVGSGRRGCHGPHRTGALGRAGGGGPRERRLSRATCPWTGR